MDFLGTQGIKEPKPLRLVISAESRAGARAQAQSQQEKPRGVHTCLSGGREVLPLVCEQVGGVVVGVGAPHPFFSGLKGAAADLS